MTIVERMFMGIPRSDIEWALRWPSSAGFSAGEFLLQACNDRWGHEARNVAIHARNLAHQSGGDGAHHRGRWQEHGLDLRGHSLVHAGHLHFVIEIRAVAQAAD